MSADWPKKRACSDNYRFFIHRVPWTSSGYTTASNSVKLFPKVLTTRISLIQCGCVVKKLRKTEMLGEDERTYDTSALQPILVKLCQITMEVNKTAKNFRLNGLEKKKVAKTYTSLILVDVP